MVYESANFGARSTNIFNLEMYYTSCINFNSDTGTTETINTAGSGNWVSENMVVIFAAGGTLFLLLAVGIIICIVKNRNKKRDQNRDYNSGT